MKKKILIVSTIAVALMVLASISPAVGSNVVKSDLENRSSSPLFSIRSQKSIETENIEKIDATYIGEGKTNNLFPIKKSNIQYLADKTIKLISENPQILPLILEKIVKMPKIINLLKANSINFDEFKNQIRYILNNPKILKEKILDSHLSPQRDDPQPLGLSTSSALGCFIIVLVMAPILALIGAIIATLTIITCIVPSCFEELVGGMLDSFVQGLEQPK